MPWNTVPAERKSGANGTKHKAGSDAFVPFKRSKTYPGSKSNSRTAEFGMSVDESDHDPSPNAQVVSYASHRLLSSLAINQSFQFIMHDSAVSLWWIDRCSIIASDSIDLVADYLVVLLDIVQCLRENKRGQDRQPYTDLSRPDLPPIASARLDETPPPLGLGSLTHSMDVAPTTNSDQHSIAPDMSLGVVTKVSRKEEHHNDEARAFTREYQVARGDDDDTERLPGHSTVLRTPDDYNDDGAEQMAKVYRPRRKEHRCRLLHLLSFARMEYIHQLSNEEFMSAFYDCFRCHGRSWLIGIHHRDICENNLLFTRVGGHVVGVLNDLDMCIVRRDGSSPEYELTGTIPFMAYALLLALGKGDSVPHLYEHDVESFAYVGLWICARYKEGKLTVHGAYRDWMATVAPPFIAGLKRGHLTRPAPATESHTGHFAAIMALTLEASRCISRADERGVEQSSRQEAPLEPPQVYFERLCGLLDTEIKSMDSKYDEYLQAVARIMEDYQAPHVLGLWRSWQDLLSTRHVERRPGRTEAVGEHGCGVSEAGVWYEGRQSYRCAV
ncbi:hypothetical protein OE88DRAFT_1667588 [Heliocybe sulcata]|uniref:Fungal-type protein kinase domain-containing protein n=1 Tax=Heliocybe sulcata TaxID=5364 RepID=A0A5C3MP47_9AGAM|nr:hypothetical protein OE88DRAFT_1667588 [Heliocybe sulcata]